MKIIAISDTHGLHNHLKIPDGDMIIHAGDFCNTGAINDFNHFIKWYKSLPHTHKVCIAGNHDHCMQKFKFLKDDFEEAGIVYLEDSSITIEGIKFYGSPWTPEFLHWAFMYRRGHGYTHWDNVPKDTDILITHGPSYGILDMPINDGHIGCEELLNKVKQLSLTYHIFGHIHESYGIDGYRINASSWDHINNKMNKPIELTT